MTSSHRRQSSELAITTSGLRRCFGSQVALDDVDLKVPTGGVTGLVGPNGSGKSTLMRILLGLIRPTAGTATVLGEPVSSPARYLPRVGTLIEYPALEQGLSARAYLAALAHMRSVGPGRVDEVLATVGLADRAADLVAGYSLGMKQRLGISMALLADPVPLLLDEPANGLDPAGVVESHIGTENVGAHAANDSWSTIIGFLQRGGSPGVRGGRIRQSRQTGSESSTEDVPFGVEVAAG